MISNDFYYRTKPCPVLVNNEAKYLFSSDPVLAVPQVIRSSDAVLNVKKIQTKLN